MRITSPFKNPASVAACIILRRPSYLFDEPYCYELDCALQLQLPGSVPAPTQPPVPLASGSTVPDNQETACASLGRFSFPGFSLAATAAHVIGYRVSVTGGSPRRWCADAAGVSGRGHRNLRSCVGRRPRATPTGTAATGRTSDRIKGPENQRTLKGNRVL